MATYSYTQTVPGSAGDVGFAATKVEFNCTPTPNNVGMGPGDTITITGKITVPSASVMDVSSIQLWLVSDYSTMSGSVRKSKVGSVSVSCDAGSNVTFTLTTTLTSAMLSGGVPNHQTGYLRFGFNGHTGTNTYYYTRQTTSSGQRYLVITTRANPSVSLALSDLHGADPLTTFGGYLQGTSLPRARVTWTLDSYDSKLTVASVRVYVKDADSNTIYDGTVPTSQSGRTADFELPAFSVTGAVTVHARVTDSAGKTGAVSQGATVLAYSPPGVGTFQLVRCRKAVGTGEYVPADDGEYIRMTLAAHVAPVNGANAWTATLTAWRAGRSEISPVAGAGRWEDANNVLQTLSGWNLGGSDGETIARTDDTALLDGMALSAAYGWSFRLTIEDQVGAVSVLDSQDIRKAGALFDIEQTGVAVGKRSTGTAANPLFECAWPARLLGGIAGVGGGALCASSQLALGFQVGGGNYGSTFSADHKDLAFTFPTAYKAGTTPHVVVGLACSNITNSNAGGVAAYVLLNSITNTGFSVRIFNRSSQALNPGVTWMAIGEMEE